MTREEYTLRSSAPWVNPEDVGQYFIMSTTAITTGDQSAVKGEWTYKNNLSKSHMALKMALKATFEPCINKAYHTMGNVAIMGEEFGQLAPYDILQRLRMNYGTASVPEIKQKLLLLNDPMDRNLPVKVMIKNIEDIQKFLLVNPTENMQMSPVQLIMQGLIKLTKTGGLYAKAI